MELVFLGTGAWQSNRRKFALYIRGEEIPNVLFECPAHVPGTLARMGLPMPDAVFVSHLHPDTCSEWALREVWQPKQFVGKLKGGAFQGFSVRSYPLVHGREKTVGFGLFCGSKKLLAVAPECEELNTHLIEDALIAVVDGGTDGAYRHVDGRSALQTCLSYNVGRCLFSNITEESDASCLDIPGDGDVYIMSEQTKGIRLPYSQVEGILEGAQQHIVLSRPFEEYAKQPIVLCDESRAYGRIVLEEAKLVDRSEVGEYGVTDEERIQRWPGASELYAFFVTEMSSFQESCEYDASNEGVLIRNIDVSGAVEVSDNCWYMCEDCGYIIEESLDACPVCEHSMEEVSLQEMVKKEGNEVILYSKDGDKVLGRFKFGDGEKYADEGAAREAAMKREKEIQYFKHRNQESQEPSVEHDGGSDEASVESSEPKE